VKILNSKIKVGLTDNDVLELINEIYDVVIKTRTKEIVIKCRQLTASEYGVINNSEDNDYIRMTAVVKLVIEKPKQLKEIDLPFGFVVSAYNQIIDKSFLQYNLEQE